LSRFYRIGLDEYCFLRELDGTQTVAAILTRLAQRAGGQTFSENEALKVLSGCARTISWLLPAMSPTNTKMSLNFGKVPCG
jgi:hypothetical protein